MGDSSVCLSDVPMSAYVFYQNAASLGNRPWGVGGLVGNVLAANARSSSLAGAQAIGLVMGSELEFVNIYPL